MDEANELLWVKGGPRLGQGKVGLSEADPSHPPDPINGAPEVFIYDGGTAVLVAPTPGVLAGLSDGRLALASVAEVSHAKAHAEAIVARNKAFQEATQGFVLTPLPPAPPPAPPPPPPEAPPAPAGVIEQLVASGQQPVTEKRETAEPAPASPAATPVGGSTTASTSTGEGEAGARRRP